MNCKQGDIAIVVRSPNGMNFGKIVTCLRLATGQEIFKQGVDFEGPIWVVDRSIVWRTKGVVLSSRWAFLAADETLKPLPGNEQDDTTETTEREVVQ